MNPFYSRKIYCPVCEAKSEVQTLIGAVFNKYYPVRREKDQYVPQWKWYDESWDHINPYLYAIIFCPLCHYCNFQEAFSYKNKSDIPRHYSYLREKKDDIPDIIKEILKEVNCLYSKNISMRNHTTAILGIICAVFWEIFFLEKNKHTYPYRNIGRLYLRLSWLYREQRLSGNANNIKPLNEIEKIVVNMVKHLKDFCVEGRKIPFLTNNFSNYKKEQVSIIIETLDYAVSELSEKTSEILDFFSSSNNISTSPETLLLEKSFALFDWIPKNEKDALIKAAQNFEAASTHDEDLNDKALWKLLELIAYLYEKCEMPEKRDLCLREIIKSSNQKRAVINGKLRKKTSYAEKCDLEYSLKKLNTYIEEISYSYKENTKINQ